MEHSYTWSNLPSKKILIAIVNGLSFVEDYFRFTAVCKSWNSVTQYHPPLLPPKYPLLLLVEDVVPGSIISDAEYDSNAGYSSDSDDDQDADADDNSDHDDVGEIEEQLCPLCNDDPHDKEFDKDLLCALDRYDHHNNSTGSSRGLYSLSIGRTYTLELPEASGRLILGANHGRLLTLGRDLQIHLLHPLSRYQISLPPMLTLPIQCEYDEYCTPEERSDMFICKAALSSEVAPKDTDQIVMVCYGECGYLAFARLGDKAWTHVDLPEPFIEDIVYHRGRFYTVKAMENVFVCHMDDKGGARAIQIASLPFLTTNQKYLVESVSGTLLLLVRNCKEKYFNLVLFNRRCKYRTTDFLVWKLDLKFSADTLEIPSCTLIEEKSLGNQAIFVGRNSSVSVSPSETIRPNCIYFTDDRVDCYRRVGGGHDMGIFNMEDRTIEPRFPGKSIHLISLPLWYPLKGPAP